MPIKSSLVFQWRSRAPFFFFNFLTLWFHNTLKNNNPKRLALVDGYTSYVNHGFMSSTVFKKAFWIYSVVFCVVAFPLQDRQDVKMTATTTRGRTSTAAIAPFIIHVRRMFFSQSEDQVRVCKVRALCATFYVGFINEGGMCNNSSNMNVGFYFRKESNRNSVTHSF